MISSNRPTDWGPDRGGVQIGGGSRSGGGVQVKDLLSNTFFVLAVCGGKIFSNFLEGGGGARSGGVVGYIFSIGIFVGNFFSNFLKFSRNTFLCIGILGKFSQIFSKVSVDFEQNICPKWCGVGCRLGGRVQIGEWYAGYSFSIWLFFGKTVSFVSE